MKQKTPLYIPTQEKIKNSNFSKYFEFLKQKYNKKFKNYDDLHKWSVKNIETFWESIFDFTKIKTFQKYSNVLDQKEHFYESKWFTNCQINFAENLLRFQDDKTAIISITENQDKIKISYAELYEKVLLLSSTLRKWGIKKGDRVVAYTPNIAETVIMMLATTSIGAIFSSTSIDFGVKGVIDRFGQIKPKILLTANGYTYKGKKISSLNNIENIVSQLNSIEKVIIVPFLKDEKESKIKNSISWNKALEESIQKEQKSFNEKNTSAEISKNKDSKINFEPISFQDPVYIMYTSGTTGLPKCIVQGSGVLVNHLKELILHTDLTRKDIIFYFTTTGWMMWNWLVSSLAVGATIVLYEGNPAYPEIDTLWKIAEKEKISIFGTGAKYIDSLMNLDINIAEKFDLSVLKTILSTGSPLSPANYSYVYSHIKEDVQLSSIAGGTDLNGCFVLGNPILPVYEGEIQCKGLGMDVQIFDDAGSSIKNTKGELVCLQPFPSMPLYFWEDENKSKYKNAYFSTYRNIWKHGDFAEVTDKETVIIYGRSDATLNPGGVRIGTSDIYELLEQLPDIEDSLVIGKSCKDDIKIILFLKRKTIHDTNIYGFKFTQDYDLKIKTLIKEKLSPRHVPFVIYSVKDIPYTLNMKKVELVVKKIFDNENITNKDALKNPECLDEYRILAKNLKND